MNSMYGTNYNYIGNLITIIYAIVLCERKVPVNIVGMTKSN
jgi:hypothetical protein